MLLIDNRAGSCDIPHHLPKSVPYTLTTLSSADVCFTGNGPDGPVAVGVEHKKIGDLVNCITTGRLSGSQLIGMSGDYHYLYLLVEGVWRSNPQDGVLEIPCKGGWCMLNRGYKGGFRAEAVTNYLNSLQIMCNIVVVRTGTGRESGEWIASVYRWWQKEWGEHKSLKTCYYPAPAKVYLYTPGLVHRVCKELQGVGWERGEEMAKKYNTLEALMEATEKDLMAIPGIGKVLAKSIMKELHGG